MTHTSYKKLTARLAIVLNVFCTSQAVMYGQLKDYNVEAPSVYVVLFADVIILWYVISEWIGEQLD